MRKRVTRRRCSRSLRGYGGVLCLTLSSLEQGRFRVSLPSPVCLHVTRRTGALPEEQPSRFEHGFERRAPTLSPMQRRLSATMSVECFKAASCWSCRQRGMSASCSSMNGKSWCSALLNRCAAFANPCWPLRHYSKKSISESAVFCDTWLCFSRFTKGQMGVENRKR